MKKKVRTSWVEFFRTGKLSKYIEMPDRPKPILPPVKPMKMPPVKPIKKKTKKYHWECITTFIGGTTSTITTVEPDTKDYNGFLAFEDYLEWFQCSNDASFIFRSLKGVNVYPREMIVEIQIIKKEMK
jgi:hypothetical protein